LDLVAGRSAAALAGWLAERTPQFRAQVQVVAMDGFGGYKNAATTAVPHAVTVMDPCHVVALAGAKLGLCRQRVQQDTTAHRGLAGDPLYRARRTLRTRTALLTTLTAHPAGDGVRRRGARPGRGDLAGLSRSSPPTPTPTRARARPCSPV